MDNNKTQEEMEDEEFERTGVYSCSFELDIKIKESDLLSDEEKAAKMIRVPGLTKQQEN